MTDTEEILLDLVKEFLEAAENDGHEPRKDGGNCQLCEVMFNAKEILEKMIVYEIPLGAHRDD